MKHIWLATLLTALPWLTQTAAAQPSVRGHYSRIAGSWQASSAPGIFEISYSVAEDRLVIAGEACDAKSGGNVLPRCRFIDQTYLWDSADLLREDPEFGLRRVEILELTEDSMIRRETHPVLKDHSAVTKEELRPDGTLHIVSETWVSGEPAPKSRREYTLRRADSL